MRQEDWSLADVRLSLDHAKGNNKGVVELSMEGSTEVNRLEVASYVKQSGHEAEIYSDKVIITL